MVWADALLNHEIGKHVERVFQKNLLKPNAASHNNASWYTDTDGFLEHSPSRENLYYKGAHSPEYNSGGFLGPPLTIFQRSVLV